MKNNKTIAVLFSLAFFLLTTNIAKADDSPPPDTTPPVITLLGEAAVTLTQNSTYTDAGATAADDVDGDITPKIATTNTVNTAIPGTNTVTYNVSDTAGNAATPVTRSVIVTPLTTTIHLTVITDTQTLYDQDETVSACESGPGSGVYTVSGYCAILQSGLVNNWSWFGADGFLNSLGGVANDSGKGIYWSWFGDLTYGATSLNAHALTTGEQLLLNYNINPLKLASSDLKPTQHDTVILTLTQFGLDSNFNGVWTPAASGSITVNDVAHAVGSDGAYSLALDSASPYVISGSEAGFINSNAITLNPTAAKDETVLIRNGDTIIYQGTTALPAAGTVSIADDKGTTHAANADSVLGVLYALDQTSANFSLSDLQYYDSFGSFYLKCLTPDKAEPLCDNWQYVVDGQSPATSLDLTILSGGESLSLYFGNPHQIVFNQTTITTGGSFTATAQKYNSLDNTWGSLTGVTISATQPNPDDPYNPTVITSGPVDANGSVTLALAKAGTYDVGLAEDFYFPSYAITVNNTGSSGGGGGTTPTAFSVSNALNYLTGVQGADGSFGNSGLYTDWAGIALGAAGDLGNTRAKVLTYLNTRNSLSSLLTDNERRAIALLALGQNPYSFNGTNYITVITASFDGAQFGDAGLINDDIFALIPLASSGYTAGDEIIAKDIAFILEKQQANGSWENGVDLTAAAVQALSPFNSVSGVSDALTKAGSFLQTAQGADGGWGNISSSSWAGQVMSALGASWTKNGKTIADYLAAQQTADGAALASSETLPNRVWATSYAIPAALGKPWGAIMQSVPKPTVAGPSDNTEDNSNNDNTPEDNPTDPLLTEPIVSDLKPPDALLPITGEPPTTMPTDQPKVAGAEIVMEPAVINALKPKTKPKTATLAATGNTNAPIVKPTTPAENNTPATENSGLPAAAVPIALASGSALSLLYFIVRRFFW